MEKSWCNIKMENGFYHSFDGKFVYVVKDGRKAKRFFDRQEAWNFVASFLINEIPEKIIS